MSTEQDKTICLLSLKPKTDQSNEESASGGSSINVSGSFSGSSGGSSGEEESDQNEDEKNEELRDSAKAARLNASKTGPSHRTKVSLSAIESESANWAVTACDVPTPYMEEHGESFVPTGWGPLCNYNKDMGTGEAHKCFADLYLEALEAYENCVNTSIVTEVGEHKKRDELLPGPPLNKEKRGTLGIVNTVKFSTGVDWDCKSIEERMKEQQNSDEPEEPYEPEESSTSSSSSSAAASREASIDEKTPTIFDNCLKKLTVNEGAPDENAAASTSSSGGGGGKSNSDPRPHHPPAELGIPKGGYESCACTDCMIAENRTDSWGGDTSSSENREAPSTTEDYSSGIDETETEEDDDIATMPLCYGTNVVTGVLLDFDDKQLEACAATLHTYTATFGLASNAQAAVLRVFHEGLDVTSQLQFMMSVTSEGHTHVNVMDVPTAWAKSSSSVALSFEIVEDYALVHNAVNFVQTQAGFEKPVVLKEHNRLWMVDAASKELCEFYLDSLVLKSRHALLIPADYVYKISPVGDVVFKQNGNGNVNIHSFAAAKTVTVTDGCHPDAEDFHFTSDGWRIMNDVSPYHYDTEKMNPVKFTDSWANRSFFELKQSAYLIHFDYVPNAWQDKCVAVPAHVADIDIARVQSRWKVKNGEYHSHSQEVVFAYNTQDVRSIVYSGQGTVDITEFPREYPYEEVWNTDNQEEEIRDEDGNVPSYRCRIDLKALTGDPASLMISVKYRKIVGYDPSEDALFCFDYNSLLAFSYTYHSFGGTMTDFGKNTQQPLKKHASLPPEGFLENHLVEDVYAYYIDTSHNIVRIDIPNLAYDIIGHVNEAGTIAKQYPLGGSSIGYFSDGTFKKVDIYRTSSFDVAYAVKRMYEQAVGYPCVVEDSVPSYIRGFVVKDDMEIVLNTLAHMTELRTHMHNGDGVLTCTRGGPPAFTEQEFTMFKEFRHGFETAGTPHTTVSYMDSDKGRRRSKTIEGTYDNNVLLKTNANAHDGYPLAINTQRHAEEKANWNKFIVPVKQGMESTYDSIEINVNSFEINVEHTAHASFKISPPDVVTTEFVPSKMSAPVRRVIGLDDYDDISLLTFGYMTADDEITLYNYDDKSVDEKMLFGLRNSEKITFDALTSLGSNVYKIEGIKRAALNSEAPVYFNKTNKNEGLWLLQDILTSVKSRGNDRHMRMSQIGMNISSPYSKQGNKKVPAPVNITATRDGLKWHSRASNGTNKYLLMFYWNSRTAADIRYLFNTVQNVRALHDLEDILTAPANRFMDYMYVDGETETTYPPHRRLTNLTKSNYSSLIWTGETGTYPEYWTGIGTNDSVNDSRMMEARFKSEDYKSYTYRIPPLSKPLNLYLWSAYSEEIFHHISVGGEGFDYAMKYDALDDLFRMQGIPSLTAFVDYIGSRAMQGPLQTLSLYPDFDPNTELSAGPGGAVMNFPEAMTPFRYILQHILFPGYNKLATWTPAYSSEDIVENSHSFWDSPGYEDAPLDREFLERTEVVYRLLDQFYLHKHVPYDKYPLLEKYGVQPPYSTDVHDPSGEWVSNFWQDTIKKHWRYKRLGDTGYLNVLIAEEQQDGTFGHFAIHEQVPVTPDRVTCGNRIVTEDISLKTRNCTTYAVIDMRAPACCQFSISYVVAPYTPPQYYADLRNVKAYMLSTTNRVELTQYTAYAAMLSFKTKINRLNKYCVLSM